MSVKFCGNNYLEGGDHMINPRYIKAKLVITCDVLIDDQLRNNIAEQYHSVEDEEVANQTLYAFLYSKMPHESSLNEIDEYWDGVCHFKGRFSNLMLTNEP